jgi:N-acetyl-D-muramate 6-phosphate phosphatase
MPHTRIQTTEIKAVLFDLDGTLIDSAPDLGAAADKLRTDRGLPPIALDQYRPMAGAGARGMIGVAFGFDATHPEYENLREEFYVNYESALTQRTFAFAGVAVLLQALRVRQLAWGVVTNKAKRFTEPLVAQMPLLAPAGVVISGDTTPHAKPHPEPLLEAARRLGLAPAQCAYVGDDKRDMDAALAAGMPALAAAWGYLGAHDISEWGAHALLQTPGQVLDWVDAHNLAHSGSPLAA